MILYQGGHGNAVPVWAAGMAVGEWRQIGLGTRMNPTAPNAVIAKLLDGTTASGGGNVYSSRLNAYCGMGMDTRTSTAFTLRAGGHGDYFNNEVVKLDLMANEPEWEVVFNGSNGNVITPSEPNPRYTDDIPASCHTYYGTQTIERHDRWLGLGGSVTPTGTGIGDSEGWNVSTPDGDNGYDPADVYPNIIAHAVLGIEFSVTKDADTENIYCLNEGILRRLVPSVDGPDGSAGSGGTVSVFLSGLNGAPGLNSGNAAITAVDHTRGIYYWTHGMSPTPYVARTINLEGTPVCTTCSAYSGAAASALLAEGTNDAGGFYEPNLDAYLLRFAPAGGAVYKVDAASVAAGTPTVTLLSTTGGDDIEAQAGSGYQGICNKFALVPALRGAIYISGAQYQAWFLRLY